MDLILRNARVDGAGPPDTVDIGIAGGRIAAIAAGLAAEGREIDLDGRLAVAGFVETHIHLDKSCLLDRCEVERGGVREAIRAVAQAKRDFTVEDIQARAVRTLEKCILHGTTHMRTHVEVDPVVGLKGMDAILPLVDAYRWAIDIDICVFPQEGLINNPGTDDLLVESLRRGAQLVGGCPYTDTDPIGQIDRIFEMAREFDVDIDFHLDMDTSPRGMTVGHVCDLTERYGYGGRVTVGHVNKLTALPTERLRAVARRLADCGVAVTVLPSTDLYLMGGDSDHDVMRGVTPVHRLLHEGVNCALSTNNVLNPFTPYGDGSLIRMANLYANTCHVAKPSDIRECLRMVTDRAARIMRRQDYGIVVGNPADLAVLDCGNAESAVQEVAAPLMAFKNGRQTFTRRPAELHRP